jgi:Cys-rich four helix bundle protein (predicted Tat secretion target)
MNRRELFTTAGAAILVASSAFAQDAGHDHMMTGHDHMAMGTPPNAALVDAAALCSKTGLVCINHCLESFAAGDIALAGCARSVDQMLSVCGALAKLASTNSPHLPAMAKVALAMCQDCETECRKHADHHAECKACADACAACAEECKKIAA